MTESAPDWIHGPGLRRAETHSKEPLPIAPGNSAAGAKLIERAGGQMDELKDGSLIHDGGIQSGWV